MAVINHPLRRRAAAASLCVAIALALMLALPAPATAVGWVGEREIASAAAGLRPVDTAIAPNGTVHLLLRRAVSNPETHTDTYELAVARRRPGRSWESPQTISTADVGFDEGDIFVSSSGMAYVAWAQLDSGNRRVRLATRPVGGAWSTPSAALSLTGSDASRVQVVADAADTATVVWKQAASFVFGRRVTSAGVPENLFGAVAGPDGAESPDAVIAPDGEVTVVWVRQDGSEGVIESNHRAADGGWGTGAAPIVSSAGDDASMPRLAADDNGTVYATWRAGDAIRAARRPAGGGWDAWSTPLSSAGAEEPEITAAGDGRVAVAWIAQAGEESRDTFAAASVLTGGTWSEPQVLGGIEQRKPPAVLTDARGNVTVVWESYRSGVEDDYVALVARRFTGGSWRTLQQLSLPDTNLDESAPAAVDAAGSVWAVWRYDGEKSVVSRVLDVQRPVTTLTHPTARWSLGKPDVRWSGTDVTSGIKSYRVRHRSAGVASGFETYTTWLSATTATASKLAGGTPGATYCFSARSTDRGANHSTYTRERCTALPLNDRALTASAGWKRNTATAAYRGTYSGARTQGAELKTGSVKAKRIVLVATRAAGAGRVTVFLGKEALKTVSLAADTAQRRQVIPIATFDTRRTGVVRIVTTNAKPVAIEGLGVSAK